MQRPVSVLPFQGVLRLFDCYRRLKTLQLDQFVEAVTLKDVKTGAKSSVPVAGIFIAVGVILMVGTFILMLTTRDFARGLRGSASDRVGERVSPLASSG